HRPGILAEDVETRRRRLEAAEEHFLPAARGIEVGETGWYFTGRERLLRDVISWLATARSGMLVVTGPPGAGKSAVMGRLATMSDPHYRERARAEGGLATIPPETLPPEGVVDVALHGRGKTFAGFVAALGQGLGISTPAQKTLEAKYILEAVAQVGRRVTVLVDGLDEAKPGHAEAIALNMLRPLARLPGVRVLVGTRRSPDGSTIPAGEDRHSRLHQLVGG